MLQKLPSMGVLAVLGAPHIGVTRAFSAFLEAKKKLFGSTVALGICLKNTLERCVACVILYNLREKSAAI